MVQYNEQMEVLSSRILTGAIQDRGILLETMTSFSKELFRDENYILYTVLLQFKEDNLVPDAEFLNIYLHRNKDIILKDNGQFINTALFDSENEYVDEIIASTIETLEDYRNTEIDEQFKENIPLDKAKLKELYKSSAMTEILEDVTLIVRDSLKVGKRVYSGVDDASEYFNSRLAQLNTIVTDEVQQVFDMREVSLNDETGAPIRIGDFGDLGVLNDNFGGIYTQMFYSVIAPTKGGKSKFCYRQTHNVAIVDGQDVMFWTAEGGRFKAKAELRAIHFVYYWEQIMGESLSESFILDPDMIRRGNYPNERLRDMELESSSDLDNNPSYGKIHFIDVPLRIDTYSSIIENSVNKFKPKLLVVDYLQYMLPAESGMYAKMSKSERIGLAYIWTLGFVKTNNIAFLTPAQMHQDGIRDLAKGNDVDTRTLGGESSEIVRTPDYNIALYGTPEDIRNGHMQLLSIPSREAKPFPPTPIGVNLAYDYYYSDSEGGME